MVKKIFAVVGSALLFLLIIGASSAADIDINNDGTFRIMMEHLAMFRME